MTRAAPDEVDGQQHRPQQQAERTRHARQHRAATRSRRRAPPHGDDDGRPHREREVEHTLHRVDDLGDLRVRDDEQEGGGVVGEDQPERGENDDLDDHRADEHAIGGRPQPAARAVGQEQRDEEERPQVREPARDGRGEQGLVLGEERRQEEREAGGRHEHAAAAVRAALPGDQATGGEGAADQAQDDLDGIHRAAAEHERARVRPPRPPQRRSRAAARTPRRWIATATRSSSSEPLPVRGRTTVSPAIASRRSSRGPPAGGRSGWRPTVDRATTGSEGPREPTDRAQRAAGCQLGPPPSRPPGRPATPRGRERSHRGRGRTRARRSASPCARRPHR